jgi:hypothetical protein
VAPGEYADERLVAFAVERTILRDARELLRTTAACAAEHEDGGSREDGTSKENTRASAVTAHWRLPIRFRIRVVDVRAKMHGSLFGPHRMKVSSGVVVRSDLM